MNPPGSVQTCQPEAMVHGGSHDRPHGKWIAVPVQPRFGSSAERRGAGLEDSAEDGMAGVTGWLAG